MKRIMEDIGEIISRLQMKSEQRQVGSSLSGENMLTLADRLAEAKRHIGSGKSEKAYRAMRIPKRYWGKTLDTGNRKLAVAVLDGRSLVITGGVGSGKTHLAVGIMLEWFAENLTEEDISGKPVMKTPLFLSLGKFFMELKQGFCSNTPEISTGITTHIY